LGGLSSLVEAALGGLSFLSERNGMKLFNIRLGAAVLLACLSLPALAQNVEAGSKKAEPCLACHGVNGNSTLSAFPILAGQGMRYIYLQLKDFKEGRRQDPSMDALVANLTREDMFDLGAFFAAQKMGNNGFKPDAEKAARGKAKADETLCTMCHLGELAGQNEIPRVGGQHYDYTVKQLKDFKARRRTNDAGNMTSVAKTLSDEDIDNLGHYAAGLH
jgi:cytochrome c553